ncbi:hypothetical protein ACQP2F_03330 [Actinoplanes sp. CA-030573]|uniref:hypothetical protein n=1 Tax=Actinoplanes sp. CA-030573 TaxID=3239898 RepID=UPI003D94B98A
MSDGSPGLDLTATDDTGERVADEGVADERVTGKRVGREQMDGDEVGGERKETTTPGERTGFRLAAFGALLVVVLFAGYGLGRLNNGTASAEAPTTAGQNAGAMQGQNGGAMTGQNGGAAHGQNDGSAHGQNGGGEQGQNGGGEQGQNGGAMPGMAMDESQPHSHDGATATPGANTAAASLGGLSLSQAGLTLEPVTTTFAAGKKQRLAFRIAGPGGAAVTTYQVVHDKLLHLVVVRRDLSGFQHVHPSMAADGTWGIDLTLGAPGIYRMVADFTALVGGQPVPATLGTDLTVAGDYAPRALPAPAHAVAADGFAVGYEGSPSTRSTQPILVSVAGPDRRPAVLEPYLGAYGHLVVLRAGDLAYVHVHPEADLVDGKVKFWLAAPSAGTYRMFFDFQVAGAVHTAAWTVTVE